MKSRRLVTSLSALLIAILLPLSGRSATGIQPGQIKDLGLWLTAADLTTNHRNDQVVTRWPDRSGNGYDAIYEPLVPQANLVAGVHNPPTYLADAVGGQPAVAFDAANREGLILNRVGHALGQRTPGFTAIFLVRPALVYGPKPAPDAPWTKNRYLFLTHVSNYNSRFSLQIVEDTGEVKLFSRAHPSQLRVTQNSSFNETEQVAVTGGQWHRVIGTVNYETKEARIVIDGRVLIRRLPADSADVSEDVPSPITGIASTTLGDWLTCDVAEMLCYQRALTVEELQSIDRYLTDKYRLKP